MSWVAVDLSAQTAGYAEHHTPLGTQGLWKHKGWQLPAYIQNVAVGLMKDGKDRSTAIAMAVAAVERWKDGRGNVSPEVQAASAKAWVEWETMRAKTHSTSRTGPAIELMTVATPAGVARYNQPIGTVLGQNGQPVSTPPSGAGPTTAAGGSPITAQAHQLVSSMPDAGLIAAHQRLAAMGASGGPDVAAASALVSGELAKRGYSTNADGSITRTQIGQGGLTAQNNQQARQDNYANQQKIAAAKLAARQQAAAAKKAAPKKAKATKPKSVKPKAAAAAKPHWFTNTAESIDLSAQGGYSGRGMTDRFGRPIQY